MNNIKKQVVLIMTDTQRKDMLGCYNKELEMHTPNIDRLAEEGIKFEKGYTCQPVCGPARSAIFTGTYPHTNGGVANTMPLNQQAKTIGQRLSKEGIHSAYIGKWHLDGGDYFGNGICPDGWDADYWFDMRNYLDKMTEEDRIKSRQFQTVFNEDVSESFTFAHQCSDKAIDFITKHKDEDYFLVVSYDEPHDPFLAPSKYFEPFKDRQHTDNDNLEDNTDLLPEHIRVWQESNKGFNPKTGSMGLMGCNAFVDKQIGRVIDTIDAVSKDATIIYTSDHGDLLGSHGILGKGPAMYDEITNIPFIIRDKSRIKEKMTSNDPVSHIDLVPTIVDLFNLPISPAFEGNSLKSYLEKENIKVNEHVFIEFTRYEIDHDGFGGFQPIRAITDGQYKLVINLLSSDELYDVANDPGEVNNLIYTQEYQEIRNKLHNELLNWMNETRDPFRGYYWERRPWREDASEATWAYTGMTRQRITEEGDVHQLDYSTGLEITDFARKK